MIAATTRTDERQADRVRAAAAFVPFDGAQGGVIEWFYENTRRTMAARGLRVLDGASGDAIDHGGTGVVLYPVELPAPRSYRRRSKAIFVAGFAELESSPDDILRTAYPLLARSLSNLFILLVRNGTSRHDTGDGSVPAGAPVKEAIFVTPEQGHYAVPYTGDDVSFFRTVVERLAPLASSRLVIDNVFERDLPEELWEGDEVTAAISWAGHRLAELNVLPAPFPITDLLPPEDLRHVRRLFGIGGLSYGNLSARKDGHAFWMSASGVDKSNLRTVGRDILLVKGYDPQQEAIVLSVPPHRPPRRVSVDAIEHCMIYEGHPGVGAILHVHAWMDGIRSTEVNYPCGTFELAKEVATLVREEADPNRAVIGLRNHGLTITGPDLKEIFSRIEGRLLRQVPMS